MTFPEEAQFDLKSDPIPSFGALLQERAKVFSSSQSLQAFADRVQDLSDASEEGRRKGLGLWMVGKFVEANKVLSGHPNDDVAAFTHAHTLMSLGRPQDAQPIFESLATKYPDEPRPRGGALDSMFDAVSAQHSAMDAADAVEQSMAKAPTGFAESAEGHHLRGRICEARHQYSQSLEHYTAAREADPTHRKNLFRLAFTAERNGLDDLALDAYETLVSMLPIDKAAMSNLGILYEDLGRDQDAAACYDTIVRSHPYDRKARLYLDDARAGMDMYYDEDMEKKEDRLNQILRIPITDFELSVRARNCLNKMDIMTLGHLVKKTEAELLSYKNFGETSLAEIKEILQSKGLRLGMAREEAVASIAKARQLQVSADPNDVRNKPLSELKLSIRARRTVENLGCLTLGDITQHSEDELLGMPNFGVTSLLELKNKLSEHNLKLKGEE